MASAAAFSCGDDVFAWNQAPAVHAVVAGKWSRQRLVNLQRATDSTADKTDMVHDLGLLDQVDQTLEYDNGVQVGMSFRLKRFLPKNRARTR